MSNQSRVAKVLVALLVSMTIGAVVLMALGNNPPKGDLTTFSLSGRVSISSIIQPGIKSPGNRWDSVEIFYSGTTDSDIAKLTAHQGKRDPANLNCHIIVCNGRVQSDGAVLPTQSWHKQISVPSYGDGTIRICVIGDGKSAHVTQRQFTSLQEVVEHLCRKFSIQSRSIYYPRNW